MGMIYFWGLTIDTVTSIMIIVAIGLAVDYSAHIGHQMMVETGSKHGKPQYIGLGDYGSYRPPSKLGTNQPNNQPTDQPKYRETESDSNNQKTNWQNNWQTDWHHAGLTRWPTNQLTDWLTDIYWLTDWLTDQRPNDRPTNQPNPVPQSSICIWPYILSIISMTSLILCDNFCHMFSERVIKTLGNMGAAVFYGGFSTFLAFVLLAGSTSYVFRTFFKVCIL